MAKATTVRLADNVPLTIDAKYLDVFVGEYGPDLRLKGTIGDATNQAVYIRFAEGLQQLRDLGAITPATFNKATQAVEKGEVPKTGLSLDLNVKTITLLHEKPGGAKHPVLKVSLPGGKPAAAEPTSTNGGEQPVSANGNGAHPMREKRLGIYMAATHFVLDKIVPLYTEKNIPVTAENAAAMVNTIYIGETRN